MKRNSHSLKESTTVETVGKFSVMLALTTNCRCLHHQSQYGFVIPVMHCWFRDAHLTCHRTPELNPYVGKYLWWMLYVNVQHTQTALLKLLSDRIGTNFISYIFNSWEELCNLLFPFHIVVQRIFNRACFKIISA